ncbi:cytochrome c [Salinarimonas sp.]|uniref:c-type cytochrome n=1 Tax=Salinarimonas sp. TaxID=2766526 RepID=UPI0032D95298
MTHRLTRLVATLGLAAVAFGPAIVVAQGDPIAERQEIMKGVGDATRTGVQMVRGERPFDLDAARNAFVVYVDASERMPDLFPDGTETGGDTEASPAIWEDKERFVVLFTEWGDAAAAGLEQTTDATTFQAAFGTATQSCRTCHTDFRLDN